MKRKKNPKINPDFLALLKQKALPDGSAFFVVHKIVESPSPSPIDLGFGLAGFEPATWRITALFLAGYI
jgi:hypothetical protein